MSKLLKQCLCMGSSSGPRVVMTQKEVKDGFVFKTKIEKMVCDVCDKPWKQEAKRDSENA